MTTINLYQDKNEIEKGFSSRGANKGFYFSLSILFAVVATMVGLNFYIPILQNEVVALDGQITAENNKIVGLKSLENVIDIQKRLNEIKNNLQIKNGQVSRLEMNKVLDDLSADLAAGVVVDEYGYASDEVTVKFSANNFSDVAKQILNFKKSEHFMEVNLAGISRQQQGISCNVAMKIKK